MFHLLSFNNAGHPSASTTPRLTVPGRATVIWCYSCGEDPHHDGNHTSTEWGKKVMPASMREDGDMEFERRVKSTQPQTPSSSHFGPFCGYSLPWRLSFGASFAIILGVGRGRLRQTCHRKEEDKHHTTAKIRNMPPQHQRQALLNIQANNTISAKQRARKGVERGFGGGGQEQNCVPSFIPVVVVPREWERRWRWLRVVVSLLGSEHVFCAVQPVPLNVVSPVQPASPLRPLIGHSPRHNNNCTTQSRHHYQKCVCV